MVGRIENYEVDGRTVTLTPAPAHESAANWRSIYEVALDGTTRGYIVCTRGWGPTWIAYSIGDEYRGLEGWVRLNCRETEAALDKEGLAKRFVEWTAKGRCLSVEELADRKIEYDRMMTKRRAAEAEASRRLAEQRQQEEEANESRRTLVLEGLTSLRARSDLTNVETMALDVAMQLVRNSGRIP